MKATFVRRAGGLALSVVATDEAEIVLLELFLAQVQSPRHPLWIPSDGSRLGNHGEVVERRLEIGVAGADVVFDAAVSALAGAGQ